MLGFSPLSTVPFSSLSGKLLTAAVLEAINAANQESYQVSPGGVVTETGTSADSITQVKSSLGLLNEANNPWIFDTISGGLDLTGNLTVSPTVWVRQRFTPANNVTVGSVSIRGYFLTIPTADGTVEIQRYSDSSVIATVSLSPSLFSTSANIRDGYIDFSSVNAELTGGVEYSIVIKGGSDWLSASNKDLYLLVLLPNSEQKNKFNILKPTTQYAERFSGFWSTQFSILGLGVKPATVTTSAEASGFTSTADITDTVTATETDQGQKVVPCYELDSNSAQGNIINAIPATKGAGYATVIGAGNKSGNRFIAPLTGNLGTIKASIEYSSAGTTPTTQGAIELWQLNSNTLFGTPQTLLASLSVPHRTISYSPLNEGRATIEFDLSNVSGMDVTAGTGYAIVICSGSDWSVGGVSDWVIRTALPETVSINTLYSGIEYRNNTSSWNIFSAYIAGIELNYTNATLDSGNGNYNPTGLISETGAADETETNLLTANAWLTENTVNGGFINTVGFGTSDTNIVLSGNYSIGNRFIANKTAVAGVVTTRIGRSGAIPTQPGRITLWQLASNSLSALPSINLGEILVNWADISTTTNYTFDFSSLNITLTQGTGYAITVTTPSDNTGSFLFNQIIRSVSPSQYSYFQSLYSSVVGTYPSSYATPSNIFYSIDLQPVQATTSVEVSGFTSSAAITDTVTATETEQSQKATRVYDLESNSTLGSTMNATSLTAGQSGGNTIDFDTYIGNTFIATQTGHLGNVKACVQTLGTINPTTQGSVQLWQLASNSVNALPSTLLASMPISYVDTPFTPGVNTVEYDLSDIAGMTVTAGTGYAIVFAGGTDWGVSSKKFWNIIATPKTPLYGGLRYNVGGTWDNLTNLFAHGFELNYTNATLESAIGGFISNGAATETGTATETEDRLLTATRDITETGTATETEDRLLTATRSITETGTATETETNLVSFVSSLTESGTANVSETRVVLATRSITETGTGSDSQFNTFITAPQLITETGTANDPNIIGGFNAPVNLTETGTTTDDQFNLVSFVSDITETGTADETESNLVSFAGDLTETATGIDSQFNVATRLADVTETVVVNDPDTIGGLLSLADLTETGDATETETNLVSFVSDVIETVIGTDSQFNVSVRLAGITETAIGTDSQFNIATRLADITETAIGTDSQFNVSVRLAGITETATGTDSQFNVSVRLAGITETATGTDSQFNIATRVVSLTETATSSDQQFNTFITAPQLITESGNSNDSQTRTVVALRDITESGTANDTETNVVSFVSSLIESGNANVSETRVVLATRDVTETATLSDDQTNTASRIADIIELLSASDLSSAQAAFISAIQEALEAADAGINNITTNQNVSEIIEAIDSESSFAFLVGDISELLDAISQENGQTSAKIEELASATTLELAQTLAKVGVLEQLSAVDNLPATVTYTAAITEINSAGDTVVVWVFFPMDYELVTSRYSSELEVQSDEIYMDNIDVFYADDDNIISSVFVEYDEIYIDNIDVLYGNIAIIGDVSSDEIYI